MSIQGPSPHPFHYECYSGQHQGGAKFYAIHVIMCKATSLVMLRQWGKVGAFGAFKPEQPNSYSGLNLLSKALDDRSRKGYNMAKTASLEDDTLSGLMKQIDPKIAVNFTNFCLNALSPSEFPKKQGVYDIHEAARVQMIRDAEIAENTMSKEDDEILRSNPLFGMF
jgi:predicted DNA-binding WGR domain protein